MKRNDSRDAFVVDDGIDIDNTQHNTQQQPCPVACDQMRESRLWGSQLAY